MNTSISEFLAYLDREDEVDYGDFKREVDYHLCQMVASLGRLSHEQVLQVRRMREQLLWSYQVDVKEMRGKLREEVLHLESAMSIEGP
jgi:hypothetical protein